MKIMITGAGGMAGRYLINRLSQNGFDVCGITRNGCMVNDQTTIGCDLSEPIDIEIAPEVIIHTAGALPYRNPSADEYKKNNVDAMDHLIDFAVRKGVRRIINFSTIGIYGEFRDPVIHEESDHINPGVYGQSKYLAECLLRDCQSIESVSLRMPGLLGPGARGIWLTQLVDDLMNNKTVTLFNPDFITYNVIHVETLYRFLEVLLHKEKWVEDAFVLACTEGNSIREIADHIKDKTGSDSKILFESRPGSSFRLDASKAKMAGYPKTDPIGEIDLYLEER